MQLWLCPLIAFLAGSIPFGLLIAKLKGVDIRQHGSGNIGATNVLRVIGKKYGITCLILDALKGFIPVMIAMNLIRIEGKHPALVFDFLNQFALHLSAADQFKGQLVHVLTALAAVLGHNYSPWVGFKGGKGIATSAGVLIGLMPPFGVVLLLIIWLLVFASTRYVSVASITAAVALPVMTHLGARFHHIDNDKSLPTLWEAGTWNKPLFVFTLIIAILAVWKHRSNLRRLREGTENRFEPKKKQSANV
ncbi:glycerol-3-phosphate 1-O-acyltransferase PlsY [Luteolibacter pohnpeiensis]|uniref:Glycerol-3-phosphate acyltransferase n=1 Tax=Luteolibacter pohnpeiensis TaxID=454153 RepID=A0A934S4G5_9BACT|nr:glycerol-3-phosphate 1-O-acyltransferase PlsY [Luteolibacter pohnpeiensis]MBK1881040.1 glycerol-3-phosphate 1-O-acyltransferase PlsY [Luteolibacter pohnpeiensis]